MAKLRISWGMAPILMVSIVALVSILIALLTYPDIRRERSVAHDAFRERADLLTKGLNDVLANYIYLADIDSLRKISDVIQSQPDITYVDVFAPDGRFLVRSHQSGGQSDYATGFVEDQFWLNVAQDGQKVFRFDGGGLDIASPILVGEDVIGVMRFGFSGAAVSAEIRRILLGHLWQGLVLIAVGIFSAYLIARYTTKPLRDLATTAAKIGNGELDAPVPVGGTREVSALGQDLENMRSQLQELYAGLELKVEERTRELEDANRELQSLDKMKDEFVSTVSHELRTPLTYIKGAAEILMIYKDEDPAIQAEFLGIINSESDRLTRLIDDVLDLSRMESGEIGWNVSAVDLPGVIETAVDSTHALAMQKKVSVEAAPNDGLPPVGTDPDRLVQVITNLLSNAIKFTPRGGLIQVRTHILAAANLEAGKEMVEVSVSDNGMGIPAIDFDKIFNRFQQGVTSLSDRAQGTGLGLAICKEIVAHVGGTIWVESEPGIGSTFFFTVPVAKPPDQVEEGLSRPDGIPAPAEQIDLSGW